MVSDFVFERDKMGGVGASSGGDGGSEENVDGEGVPFDVGDGEEKGVVEGEGTGEAQARRSEMTMRVAEGERVAEEGGDDSTTSSGRVTVQVVPTPTVEVKPIVPFIRLMSWAERETPRPAPTPKALTWRNAVKRSFWRKSWSMPHPVSMTSMRNIR
jgi:hypothetical protein